MSPKTCGAAAILVALLAVPALLSAHAVVFPRTAAPGAYEKYVLRVPNERDVPTTSVRLRFPEGVTVVSFAAVDGWALDTSVDSAGRIIAATWTGSLPPGRFIEFPFIAVNPRSPTRIVWPATQIYAGGDTVDWTGPEGSSTPASVTEIAAAPDAASSDGAGTAEATGSDGFSGSGGGGAGASLWIASAALLVALISLGLALRAPRRAGET